MSNFAENIPINSNTAECTLLIYGLMFQYMVVLRVLFKLLRLRIAYDACFQQNLLQISIS
jgi:hypothetical protein